MFMACSSHYTEINFGQRGPDFIDWVVGGIPPQIRVLFGTPLNDFTYFGEGGFHTQNLTFPSYTTIKYSFYIRWTPVSGTGIVYCHCFCVSFACALRNNQNHFHPCYHICS